MTIPKKIKLYDRSDGITKERKTVIAATYLYPSQEAITAYLCAYQEWGGRPHLKEKDPGIIERIAKVFAHKTNPAPNLKRDLVDVLHAINYFKSASSEEYDSYLKHLESAMQNYPQNQQMSKM